MSAWRDPERWSGLREPGGCPICQDGPFDVVAELESSWVTMGERSPVRGYACLVLRRHAIELHDLSDAEGAAFMRDAQRLSRAVAAATDAVKLNYEAHGNTIPHLHLHVYPRYVGDPFEGKPIDPHAVTARVYGPREFDAMRARVLAELGASAR